MSENIKRKSSLFFVETRNLQFISVVLGFIFIFGVTAIFPQEYSQPNYYTPAPQNRNYMANSTAFKQEIARMEINVVRAGREPMSITQVPRLQKDDVLKVRMLEEPINGAKPDQSNWDWTFLVAFINPGRNNDKESSVSAEINFRKSGWYREYSFTVPYDSQPIFFLYPKPKYRDKILKLISKKYDEVRKIGEKTIDIAGAYAQIGMFLNELQGVLNQTNYGGYRSNIYNNYGGYGTNLGYNYNQFAEQTVERLAKSFNIQLPSCWQGSGYGNYNTYNSYSNYGYGGMNQDLAGKIQCVAKNVRLEDFDLSVSRLLQQGGILAVAQLQQKYPQISQWISIAAVAVDFILKITKKTPLKIVPTVISSLENQGQNYGYQNSYAVSYSNFAPNTASNVSQSDSVKISLYAESQPTNGEFVTAYPIVLHKWQADPDPEIISLPAPTLMESCLHSGQNILRNTDLTGDWISDPYSKDFKLLISSSNGFRKEFPLRKNLGMSGWDLNLTKEDLNSFPKIQMTMESEIFGIRGFNEIKSPKFNLPIPVGGNWEITPESQKAFAVGGRRVITLRNELGNCKCLQTVVYKPSFGGQFVFDANGKENNLEYSEDGKEVSFEVDASNFQPGQGQLELKQSGNDTSNLNINLYPAPPNITAIKISRGDKQAVIFGERLEQLKFIKINGKRAVVMANVIQANNLTSLNERTAVFEDPNARLDSNTITLELGLDNDRIYPSPKTFPVSPARPSIIANEAKEVEGIAVDTKGASQISSIYNTLPVFPIDTTEIKLNVQNTLTDYDFKAENISIETRIENAQVSANELPKANFEVLDWKNMKISFLLNPELQKYLGGKRLQFRIRDKERGDSDWFTIRKTFIRLPQVESVKCAGGENCELKGVGIEYIKQISTDGGKTWFPQEPDSLTVQPTSDGGNVALIPRISSKKTLQIRLRDFPSAIGLIVNNYNFVLGKGTKNP